MAAVNANMFAADVGPYPPTRHPHAHSLMNLPLNLIAIIVQHLDDVADLARICRTCRVLNYMTLPHLYKNLTLTSYDKIRYRDDRPEGCGSASPFSMGLNAVVTRNVASLVRSVTLRGEWREADLEELARVGRVPDSSMMLNIAVRAAVDKMTALETFRWELNTKMLETVYLGLSQSPKLTSLSIRFPSSRHPRPTTVIPPMPHLRSLKVTDIDPLCYPDDISTLLLRSKKLRELRMHWSPRMREAQEASVTLHDYFRKCIAAKSPLVLKKMAIHNFYALHSEEFETAFDPGSLEELTFLNGPTNPDDLASMSFVESSWASPKHAAPRVKLARHDRIDKQSLEFLTSVPLEKLYMVYPGDPYTYINSPRCRSPHAAIASMGLGTPSSDGGSQGPNSIPNGPVSSTNFVVSMSPLSNYQASLRDGYLQAITNIHGERLRHLLLPAHWPLSSVMIARLVRACPNLEQLALSADLWTFETLGLLLPFLSKLVALRMLVPVPHSASSPNSRHSTPIRTSQASSGSDYATTSGSPSSATGPSKVNVSPRSIAQIIDVDDRMLVEILSAHMAEDTYKKLRFVGMGWKAWELGEYYTMPVSEAIAKFRSVSSSTATASVANGMYHAAAGATPPNVAEPVINGATPGPMAAPEPRRDNSQPPRAWTQTSTSLGKRKSPGAQPATPPSALLAHSRPPSATIPNLDSHYLNKNSPQTHENVNTDLQGLSQDDIMSSIRTTTGEPLSDIAQMHMKHCLPQFEPCGPENLVWRRRLKPAGWEVLKHWEIWGLDVQEI